MEEVKAQTWNKKRIFIAVFLILLLMGGGYFFGPRILSDQVSKMAKSVKGISAENQTPAPDLKANIQATVKEKINSLQQEVSGLNVMEVATSSPQVQKILNDIKSLQQYPANQIQEICKKVCGL